MESWYGQILLGVAGNALSLVLLTVVAAVALNWRWQRSRRRFFGFTRDQPGAVQIKVSNMYVVPGGAVGATLTSVGYYGSALNEVEYRGALNLAGAVQTKPLRQLFQALANQTGTDGVARPVLCQIGVSTPYVRAGGGPATDRHRHLPVDFDRDRDLLERINLELCRRGTFVLVGAPIYNVLTLYALANVGDDARFSFERVPRGDGGFERGIRVLRYYPNGTGRTFVRDVRDDGVYDEYFVVQKITGWGPEKGTLFLCAGTSAAATAAALGELAKWRRLRAEFGDRPFGLLFKLVTADRETVPGSNDPDKPWIVSREWPPQP